MIQNLTGFKIKSSFTSKKIDKISRDYIEKSLKQTGSVLNISELEAKTKILRYAAGKSLFDLCSDLLDEFSTQQIVNLKNVRSLIVCSSSHRSNTPLAQTLIEKLKIKAVGMDLTEGYKSSLSALFMGGLMAKEMGNCLIIGAEKGEQQFHNLLKNAKDISALDMCMSDGASLLYLEKGRPEQGIYASHFSKEESSNQLFSESLSDEAGEILKLKYEIDSKNLMLLAPSLYQKAIGMVARQFKDINRLYIDQFDANFLKSLPALMNLDPYQIPITLSEFGNIGCGNLFACFEKSPLESGNLVFASISHSLSYGAVGISL